MLAGQAMEKFMSGNLNPSPPQIPAEPSFRVAYGVESDKN